MNRIEAHLLATDLKFAIISTRWNHLIVDRLVEGAELAFVQHGGRSENLDHYLSPGAYEVPLIARKLAESGRYDAIVCLGAVIKGDTDHYDFVAGGAANGILNTSLHTGVPVAFGVLTTDTVEQALNRAGIKAGNKGAEATLAMIETVNLLRQIPQS
ncbi:6,7-dimethyl-8-ribityllumazine synthase [Deinococcus deserti]|uniref:6,7-dimethyl-8-ribityllumazine synthase n=1 Tax=Deinococcus deserti (strain DSM 17065 / CIP 109153 / LMG 22923 / VCD115) TaxID=546414 RepID=RISB_DEIDV|nr:6,7-dimethyl-8-ribityllumazine synthase [Deinococcus deserti]C1CYL1.1 RecName: Full=6,7-dimethyl-8-ribityllumazine synthase; Short=DMRL synthase; Short=LS; Short=Lumazine synthase [Deinococcus deserti VCD115]ACO45032.1 putative 6,7-dimethyl-8-ribityllumazine synthase (DMRL synthase) (Lumazine synthase) (Riboflavin synthase beta chain) [Deinococcus deserti VCD115]